MVEPILMPPVAFGPEPTLESLPYGLEVGVKLEVDWDRCEGHGLCERTAPEMFSLDDNGEMHVLLPTDPVPSELEAKVAAAARVCPMTTLRVVP